MYIYIDVTCFPAVSYCYNNDGSVHNINCTNWAKLKNIITQLDASVRSDCQANILSKRNGWFIEMVQADVMVGEMSTSQLEKCLAML